MKKYLRLWTSCAVGAAAALVVSSCAYDPYYNTTVGGSYSTGYSSGYGGGSSTSIFVSTGDSRWGYDPYCHSYYDYHRRAYYDPYLYGYYPVGYRPAVIIGAPHPYGWSPGRGYCPPPRRVNNITISNYRNREQLYRTSSYGWARQVRQGQAGRDGFRPETSGRVRSGDSQSGRRQYEASPSRRVESRPLGERPLEAARRESVRSSEQRGAIRSSPQEMRGAPQEMRGSSQRRVTPREAIQRNPREQSRPRQEQRAAPERGGRRSAPEEDERGGRIRGPGEI